MEAKYASGKMIEIQTISIRMSVRNINHTPHSNENFTTNPVKIAGAYPPIPICFTEGDFSPFFDSQVLPADSRRRVGALNETPDTQDVYIAALIQIEFRNHCRP